MLSAKQLEEIKALQQICENEDELNLKLNWEMLQARSSNDKTDFLHYEGNHLVGFLALYGFGNKVEICGMVHPQHRRRGIFKELFQQAILECNYQGFSKILLNTPANSTSGKAFVQSVPCDYYNTEYQMKWKKTELSDFDGVVVRTSSTEEDVEAEVMLDILAFDFQKEEALQYNKRIKQDRSQHFYVIEYEGKVAGKIRVGYEENEAWVYGFAVFPELQGRGIGRKALKQIVKKESDKGFDVFLEVEAENKNALRLYESCGFEAFQAQDYYIFKSFI